LKKDEKVDLEMLVLGRLGRAIKQRLQGASPVWVQALGRQCDGENFQNGTRLIKLIIGNPADAQETANRGPDNVQDGSGNSNSAETSASDLHQAILLQDANGFTHDP